MLNAEQVARYFLQLAASQEEPTPVTQMQLHKLMYYAQGWSLATRGAALFDGTFQAWMHGPVVVELYPAFADYGSLPIAHHEACEDPRMPNQIRDFIESVWLEYGKYSAWGLREMTHREPPWKEARGNLPGEAASRAAISETSMTAYFRRLRSARCRKEWGMTADELDQTLREAREGKTIEWSQLREELLSEIKAERAESKPV